MAIADLNGDGIPDLAVATQSSGFAIFPGNGDGTFGTILRFAMGELFSYATLAVADLNGDGRPDIVVGRLAAGRDLDFLSVLINNSWGTSMAPLKNGNGTR